MPQQGQIIPRGDRTWLIRWYVGLDANKKRVYNSETIHGTHAQAQQALRKKLVAKDVGVLVAVSKESLGTYLTTWLSGRVKLAPKTKRDYQQRITSDITPTLGLVPLHKLTRSHVQGLVTHLQESRGLSPRTIQYTMAVLKQALAHAVRDGKLGKNPADHVETPKVTIGRTQTLTVDEQRRLLACDAIPLQRKARWMVALLTGMRPQEYLALGWEHIEADPPTITVQRALVEATPGHWVLGDTKTTSSVRRLPVPLEVLNCLQALQATQSERQQAHGLIFAGREGHPLDLSAVRRQWKADCATAKVPVVPLYATRHTHLTTLLEANVHPKVAQERGGHSSIRTTMDRYSHVLGSMQQEASDTVQGLIWGDTKRS